MEEDRGQPFAAFVFETLTRRSAELGQSWAERTQLVASNDDEQLDGAVSTRRAAEQLVRALVEAADAEAVSRDGVRRGDPVIRAGSAIGAAAYRRNASLHQLLRDIDLLTASLLKAAEHEVERATTERGSGTGRDGLVVARGIVEAISALRLAATSGYAQALEAGLRERYRAIRHDLRNPLGTIRSALTLLTDDSIPPEMRQGPQVRAMVVRNARSLDQMISEALGDNAARLRAFETPPPEAETTREASAEPSAEPLPNGPPDRPESSREQRDDVARSGQRPDLESGAL